MKFRNVSTEVEENVEVDTSAIDEALEKYKTILCDQTFMADLDLPVLDPSQINLVFNVIQKERGDVYFNKGDNAFLKELIYTSWRYGYNDFKFNTQRRISVNELFSNLKGEMENPILITFNGDGGDNFAQNSKNCIYNLSGSFLEKFSINSTNCTFNIYEWNSKYPFRANLILFSGDFISNTYNFFNNIKRLGLKDESKIRDCTFNIHKGIDEIVWETMSGCTFKTQDSKIYKNILSSYRDYIPPYNPSWIYNWYEKTINSFKEDCNIIEEVFFQKHSNLHFREAKDYNKIQLIK